MAKKKAPSKEVEIADRLMHDLLLIMRRQVRKFAHEIVEESKKRRQKNPTPAKRKKN